jgi:hypothetical protein
MRLTGDELEASLDSLQAEYFRNKGIALDDESVVSCFLGSLDASPVVEFFAFFPLRRNFELSAESDAFHHHVCQHLRQLGYGLRTGRHFGKTTLDFTIPTASAPLGVLCVTGHLDELSYHDVACALTSPST